MRPALCFLILIGITKREISIYFFKHSFGTKVNASSYEGSFLNFALHERLMPIISINEFIILIGGVKIIVSIIILTF